MANNKLLFQTGPSIRELRAGRDWDETGCVTHKYQDPPRPYNNYAFSSPLSSMLVGPSRKKRLLVVYSLVGSCKTTPKALSTDNYCANCSLQGRKDVKYNLYFLIHSLHSL